MPTLTLLLVVLVFAGHAIYIPIAMFAVLVMVAFRMDEWHEFRRSPSDAAQRCRRALSDLSPHGNFRSRGRGRSGRRACRSLVYPPGSETTDVSDVNYD